MKLLLFFVFVFSQVAFAGSVAAKKHENPHGKMDRCTDCHTDSKTGALLAASPTLTCQLCHPDLPHAVGIVPVRAVVPDDLPLEDGKLGCDTCHEEPEHHGKGIAADNPLFYRGGPYASVGVFCSRCHQETAAARFNPHLDMREKTGADRDTTCLFCHEEIPTGADVTADIRLPSAETCKGCHFDTTHAGSNEHLVALKPKIAAKAKKAGLPLGKGDRVTCSTCHDPHPPGATAAATARAKWSGASVVTDTWRNDVIDPALAARTGQVTEAVMKTSDMLRLDAATGDLCAACHDFGGSME